MFEKEAIRHAFEDTIGVKCLLKPVEDFTYEELSDEQQEKAYDFKKGAEFGYNKAKEWHYPSKGELPKDNGLLMSKTLNLITKMKGSDCLNLALGKYNFSTQEFDYQHMVGLTEVIAWKEIVLPKESE